MATTLAKDKKRAPVIDIVALARRAEQLQAEIDEALNQIVEGDVRTCPGVPSGVSDTSTDIVRAIGRAMRPSSMKGRTNDSSTV